MAEKEIDSKYEDYDCPKNTKNDLNTQNTKVDHAKSQSEDLKETKDSSMSLDRGLGVHLNLKGGRNPENDLKLDEFNQEYELKPGEAGEESQNNESSDLIKELSIPIELDPNFGPEKVSYDIDDLNIPIQLEDSNTPTNLKALVKKLDIPCDTEAIKSEMEQSKQKQERNMLTRYSKRNEAMQSNLNFRLNGMSYKNHLDGQDLSTSLNFRELSKKLDLNRNTLDMSTKFLRSSKLRMNKLNLEDFSKLDMNTITNPEAALLSKLDANTLSKLDLGNITKLDVNSSGKLDINDTNDVSYKKYLESGDEPLSELRTLNELKAMGDLRALSKLRGIGELQYANDLSSNEYRGGSGSSFAPKNDPQQEGDLKAIEEMDYSKEMKYLNELKYSNELKARQDSKGKKKRPVRQKNDILAPTMDPSVLVNPVELPPVTVENWAQCENCKKWRRIPLSVDTEKLPDTWVCALNIWDPMHNACSIPEEVYPDKAGDQRMDDINGSTTPLNSVSPDPSYSNDSDFNYQGYLHDLRYGDVDVKGGRDRMKIGDNYKAKYADTRYRGKDKYRNIRDERYYDPRLKSSKKGKYKYTEDAYRRGYEEGYLSETMRTPTNTNRYYEDSRVSSRRRMHMSPMVSNISSYDEESEVIKFNVKPTSKNLHPLKDRMTLYSHNLTSLLATELPHSALFLDNLKRMNLIKDDDIKDDDYGYGEGEGDKLSALAREALSREGNMVVKDKDNVFFKEDGNINIAYANKTEWEHMDGRHEYANHQNVRFNKEDIFDNLVSFGDLEGSMNESSRSGFARMYKRLSSQIPKLSEIPRLSLQLGTIRAGDAQMEGEVGEGSHDDRSSSNNKNGSNGNDESASTSLGGDGDSRSHDMSVDENIEGPDNNDDGDAVEHQGKDVVNREDNMVLYEGNREVDEGSTEGVVGGCMVGGDEESNGLHVGRECDGVEAGSLDNGLNADDAMAVDEGDDSGTNSNERSSSESVKNEEYPYDRNAPKTYGTRSSSNIGRSPNNPYSQGANGSSIYGRNKYGAYGRNTTNGYDGYSNGSGDRYSLGTRNSGSYERHRGSSYGSSSIYGNGSGIYERPVGTTSRYDTESKTDVVNRDELLEVLYSFAKQYYGRPQDAHNTGSNSMRSEDLRTQTDDSVERVEGPRNRQVSSTRNGKQAGMEEPGHKSVIYCKRYKYVDGMMQSIVDYKEQIVDKLRQEMLDMESSGNQHSSLDEYDSVKREDNDEVLDGFRDDDYLIDKSQPESEDDIVDGDDASENLERELENEFKKELLEKEFESKLLAKELLRNEKNHHLDYPLPNVKQLSKRCRNLESKSLRRPAYHPPEALGPRIMSNYSLLFQPIPDDIAASSSSDIIKMLSVPIPYKSYGDEYEGEAPRSVSSLRNGGPRAGSLKSGLKNGGHPGDIYEADGLSNGRTLKANGRVDAGTGSRTLTSSGVLLNGGVGSVPFASGVVGASDLVSSGIMGRSGVLLSSGSGHVSSSAGMVAGGSGEELKLEKFENFDLLSLPIPDLSNTSSTQCVN
ncbi:hypothetical protein MACK_001072 [Theileria orientalis]|uniref:CW-type domain-containing protein n=1 Tax=Theileria orientalis TaxID=68886 RepID=A0A976QUD9_THEOR|nr:hypothetical protein MACK_001072 [Theileria orientalis]